MTDAERDLLLFIARALLTATEWRHEAGRYMSLLDQRDQRDLELLIDAVEETSA